MGSTQWDRCDELRQNLEMIVVNGQLPRSLLAQIPPDIQQTLSNAQTSPVIEQPIDGEDEEEEQKQNHSHIQQSNGHLHAASAKHINSTLPSPKKPENLSKTQQNSDPLLNGAHEYLKKQRRCTYFNAELDFAHFLEGVSSALEQCERNDRDRLLEDN